MVDRATKLTLDYLTIIEDRLGIVWDHTGQPVCNLERVNLFTLHRMKNELTDLLRGTPVEEAITDSRHFGKKSIQTAGFGLVNDFDKLVKLGFLCGKRVILWDFLYGRVLSEITDDPRFVKFVVLTAHELLLVKRIVEAGGLVVLPHPLDWPDNGKTIDFVKQLAPNESPANLGLVATLSVEEEVPLHPYTLFPFPPSEWPDHPKSLDAHDTFSREDYAFHRAIDDTLQDARFAYLDGLPAAELFAIVSGHDGFHAALRDLLAPSTSGLSRQQHNDDMTVKRKELLKLLERRNQVISGKTIAQGSGAISVVGSAVTLIDAFATGNTTSAVASAIAGLSSGLLGYLAQYLNRSDEKILVQAFFDAKEQHTRMLPTLPDDRKG